VLFDEALPGGAQGVLQVAAFAAIVAGAGFLGRGAARVESAIPPTEPASELSAG
jgi:hypothetical protein